MIPHVRITDASTVYTCLCPRSDARRSMLDAEPLHALLPQNRIQNPHRPLIRRKQNPPRKHRPPQPHRRPPPKPPKPVICNNTPKRLDRAGAPRALTPRLDRIEGLRRECRYNPCDGPVPEVCQGGLSDAVCGLVVFEGVVGSHPKGCGAGLFERCAEEAAVEAEEA